MTLQILQYEFLGPIPLEEWGPPMEEVVYLILSREKDNFHMLFVDQCDKTDKKDFFTQNEKFKCWIKTARSEKNLYLAIFPMWKSDKQKRKLVVQKIVKRFEPLCNSE